MFSRLMKICVDFYSESEIINARSAVDSTGVRLPKRNRSSDRLRLTMEDIVKCVLDPSVQLPEFHAKNLAILLELAHCAQKSGVWVRLQQQLKP